MSQIILDISANNHNNIPSVLQTMMDEVIAADTRNHEIIFKHQLFMSQPPNIPLSLDLFRWAHGYAASKGYKTTASVFDLPHLLHLLQFDIPFVKIACRPELYWLIGEVPRKTEVYVSCNSRRPVPLDFDDERITALWCVPKYPADIEDYGNPSPCLSDHTVGLGLWYRNNPVIWEKHLKLPYSTGPDAGPFAITPTELREIL